MVMVFLIYFTIRIRSELKRGIERSNSLRNRQINEGEATENSTSKTLMAIIMVFITLHSFRIVWILGEMYLLLAPDKVHAAIEKKYGIPAWHYVTASLSEFFIVINASVNVIIYLYSEWE